jgi:hypothetical protein
MSLEPSFNWHAPNYEPINTARLVRLALWQKNPALVESSREFYRRNIPQFIEDVGITSDPRNAFLTPPRPVLMPFVLFPKQREFLHWALDRAQNREHGLVEKSRDCGVSWLSMCLAASLCLFNHNINIGVGSAKEDKICRSGDPDTLFYKLQLFLENVPVQFRGGYDPRRDSAHLRLRIPETNSSVVGESGNNIGRGGRTTLYIIDEAAHLERPELVEASLASNTDCRIDISSVRGMANVFAQKRHAGKVKVFTFSWRDDPRKGELWYQRMRDTLDPVTLASEVDIDYKASVEGALIPSAWIQAAINSHVKLGIEPSGIKHAGLDIADEGADLCAIAGRYGILLQHLQSWSGRGGDIFKSVTRAFAICDEHNYPSCAFDADGLGSGCRGDAAVVNQARVEAGKSRIHFEPFRGSGPVHQPDREQVPSRKNKDFFANAKAQAWWALRTRFEKTWRAVSEGAKFNPDNVISIDPKLPELTALTMELSNPTFTINAAGKILVDKAPDGTRSPNLADAVMIAFAPGSRAMAMEIWRLLAR